MHIIVHSVTCADRHINTIKLILCGFDHYTITTHMQSIFVVSLTITDECQLELGRDISNFVNGFSLFNSNHKFSLTHMSHPQKNAS